MKKLFALLLALCLVFSVSKVIVSAADETVISLGEENLGRGKMSVGGSITINADGSVTSATQNISFYLPEAIPSGETYTVHITGSSNGDFRVWFIDASETTLSDQWQASTVGFTSGDFDQTFTLTTTGEATEIFFKAPTWDGKIDNLTVKSIAISQGAAEATAEETTEETTTEATAAETTTEVTAPETTAEVTTTDSTPKTGDATNVLGIITVMGIATVVMVAMKKRNVVNK